MQPKGRRQAAVGLVAASSNRDRTLGIGADRGACVDSTGHDSADEAKIINSWYRNASAWTTAVREGQIESRRLVTDGAILDAVVSCSPQSVLDIGCGEGWLVRELVARGIAAVGVDVVPELVEKARQGGGGVFRAASYQEIAAGGLGRRADVVVCNFSLFGKASVEGVFRAAPSLLNRYGSFIVQTLHPVEVCGDRPYEDGWREGSWAGFAPAFTDPAPWYFRTLESWERLFLESGFLLRDVREPIHPSTAKPASVIFVGRLAEGVAKAEKAIP